MNTEITACAICDNKEHIKQCNAKSRYSDEVFKYVRCPNCNLIFVNPRQSWDEKKDHLKNADFVTSFTNKSDRDEHIYKYILSSIARYKEPAKILDVGCSTGRFLKIAREENGWDVHGIEINKSCADYCKNQERIDVFQEEPHKNTFPDSFFDAVTMIHSIEHLYSLRYDFPEIAKKIKRSGIIYIMTPNFNNYLIRFLKKINFLSPDTDALDPTGHPYMFTVKSLSNLLNANGFEIKKINAHVSGNSLAKNKLAYILPFLAFINLFDIGSTLIAIAEKK